MIAVAERYLSLEILKNSLATILILFVILMSNTLGKILSEVSEGDLPLAAVIPVFTGQSIKVLSLLMPLGFFLGVIFAFGRLYRDHELVVLHACGYGYRQLYKVLMLVMLPILLVSAACSIWLSAEALQMAKQIVDEASNINEFQNMKVGQFNLSRDHKNVFFMQSMSEDKLEIYDVVITGKKEKVNILEHAKQGRNKLDEASGDLFLEVGPGTRYEGQPGTANYTIIDYRKHGILLEKNKAKAGSLSVDEKSLSMLWQSELLEDRVELIWRFQIPISLVILGLLAVPLSYISPRQGRYGKIGWGLLVFILYLNLLGLTRGSLEKGSIPLWLNFWWVHAIFVGMIVFLLKRRTQLKPVGRGRAAS